ncbi:hypothetical protein BGX30_011193 [Mortierella sp. GBA39]|nr:hypothetical protein BGX30_011193 [Mortierella sp. GBA39]
MRTSSTAESKGNVAMKLGCYIPVVRTRLVPNVPATQWGKVFKDVPESITQHERHLFCRYVEKEAREQLWKPRYERPIRWEEESNIKNSMKRTRTTKDQRAQWTQSYRWHQIQIYGRKLREDECLCGRAVAEHKEQRCPGEQSDTQVTDREVTDALLGLGCMDIMERKDNMGIKELEEEHT